MSDGCAAIDLFGIEVQTPDEFVLNQLMLEKLAALAALKRMRERWARPQYDAMTLVALLEKRGLPQTAAHLRESWHSSSWLDAWSGVAWRADSQVG